MGLTKEQRDELTVRVFGHVTESASDFADSLPENELDKLTIKKMPEEKVHYYSSQTLAAVQELLDELHKLKKTEAQKKKDQENTSRKDCLHLFGTAGLADVPEPLRQLVMSSFSSPGKAPQTLDAMLCAAAVATPEKCSTPDLRGLSDRLHKIWEVINSPNHLQKALFADHERQNVEMLIYSIDAELWRRKVQAKLSAMSKSDTNVVEPAWQNLYDANREGRLRWPRGKQPVKIFVPQSGMTKMTILAGLCRKEDEDDAHVYVGAPKFTNRDEHAGFAYNQVLVAANDLAAMNINPQTKQTQKELQDLIRLLTATNPPPPLATPVAQAAKKA